MKVLNLDDFKGLFSTGENFRLFVSVLQEKVNADGYVVVAGLGLTAR